MENSGAVGSMEWWDWWKVALGGVERLSAKCSVEIIKLNHLKYTEQTFYAKFYFSLRLPANILVTTDGQDYPFDPMISFENGFRNLVSDSQIDREV